MSIVSGSRISRLILLSCTIHFTPACLSEQKACTDIGVVSGGTVEVVGTSIWTGVDIVVWRWWSVEVDVVVIGTSAEWDVVVEVILGSCKHSWLPSVSKQLSMCPHWWAPDAHSSISTWIEQSKRQWSDLVYRDLAANDILYFCIAIHQLVLHFLRSHRYRNRNKLSRQVLLQNTQQEVRWGNHQLWNNLESAQVNAKMNNED